MWTLPNLLSASRIALVPVMGALAFAGQAEAFLVVLVTGLFTDVADGFLARRHDQATELGAKLDSWGDLCLYAALPVCAWLLWPELIAQEANFLWVALGAFVTPLLLGLARFGRLTSYHTYAAKLTAWVMGIAAVVLFAGGPAWPFHLAVALLVYEALEEMAITITLPRWEANVPTLAAALRRARS